MYKLQCLSPQSVLSQTWIAELRQLETGLQFQVTDHRVTGPGRVWSEVKILHPVPTLG